MTSWGLCQTGAERDAEAGVPSVLSPEEAAPTVTFPRAGHCTAGPEVDSGPSVITAFGGAWGKGMNWVLLLVHTPGFPGGHSAVGLGMFSPTWLPREDSLLCVLSGQRPS